MQQAGQGCRRFGMSVDELRRREKAFDRLGLSIIVAAAISTSDVLMKYMPGSVLGILILALLFVAARTWLARASVRFAQTTWSIGDAILCRADSLSHREYQLRSVRQVQTKRTSGGFIREMRLSFDDGGSLYVNGLEDAESFRDALHSATQHAARIELHEPLDFDHPSFYIALGAVLGIVIGLLGRVVVSAPELSGRWVYAVLSVYSACLGACWWRAKPISGRYGDRAIRWDRALTISVIVLSVGSAAVALLG